MRCGMLLLGLGGFMMLVGGAGRATGGTITGVCPDGSIFVVRSERSIPCSDAKRVEPHEVPPVRPEYLPRPYNWQVYNEVHDPNNPYNLVDSARKVRELGAGAAPEAPPVAGVPAPQGLPAPQRSLQPTDLGLTDGELRDLFLIVELKQDDAPAHFEKLDARGEARLRVALAHSASFQDRFRRSWAGRSGPLSDGRVVLFSAVAREAEPFYAHFTFVQSHLTFQPSPQDTRQLGVLQGSLGDLDADEAVLGYVVLPEQMDPAQPLDVYWNDRRLTTTLQP